MQGTVVVGVRNNMGRIEVFRLSFRDEHYLSMIGEVYEVSKKEDILELAKENLLDDVRHELDQTTYAQVFFSASDVDVSDDDLLEMETDTLWDEDDDGQEWGFKCIAGGQNCDAWENLPVTEDVMWLISPEKYKLMLDFWRAHQMKRPGEPGYELIPDWMMKLSEDSFSMEGAFAEWRARGLGEDLEEGLE